MTRKLTYLVSILALLVALVPIGAVRDSAAPGGGAPGSGDAVVVLAVPAARTLPIAGIPLTRVGASGRVYHLARALPAGGMPAVLRALRADARVLAADVDSPLSPMADAVSAAPSPVETISVTSWIDTVNLRPLWAKGFLGNGVRIGVADTGVNGDGSYLPSRVLAGYNARQKNTDARDDVGHGTAVAQVAAAANGGLGVVGVAQRAQIVPARVVLADEAQNSAVATHMSDYADGILWLAGQGVNIINISFGTPTDSPVMRAAIAEVVGRGILVIASTYNDPSKFPLYYPANYPGVLAVGTSDLNGNPASFTTRVERVDLAAPGVNIPAYVPGMQMTGTSTRGIARVSGSSMAAPMVAGVAAILFGAFPDLDARSVRDILTSSASHRGNPALGAGVLDAGAAFAAAQDRTGHAPRAA